MSCVYPHQRCLIALTASVLRLRLVFLSLIEFGFFVFPSTVNSSLGLVLSMLVMIVVGWYGRPVGDQGLPVPREKLQ